MPAEKLRVLFLCTGNSCRSQMAEGWTRALHGDRLEAFSAGLKPEALNPRAVAVMAEAGVDISEQESKDLELYLQDDFDLVVTVCSNAHDACPAFPGKAPVIHQGFEDPPLVSRGMEDEESILAVYRRVRDEIERYVFELPELVAELQRSAADTEIQREDGDE